MEHRTSPPKRGVGSLVPRPFLYGWERKGKEGSGNQTRGWALFSETMAVARKLIPFNLLLEILAAPLPVTYIQQSKYLG